MTEAFIILVVMFMILIVWELDSISSGIKLLNKHLDKDR
jgi:preprotein translocase subunit SecE